MTHAWPRPAPWGLLLWLLVSGLGLAGTATLEDKATAAWSAAGEARLKQLLVELQGWQDAAPDEATLSAVQQEVTALRERAEACVTEFSGRLTAVQERLKALGELDTGAAAEIRNVQKGFQSEQTEVERQLAICRLIALNARDVKDAITQQYRAMRSREMLHREQNVWQTVSDLLVNGPTTNATRQIRFDPWPALGAGALLLALLLPLALVVSRVLRERFLSPASADEAPPSRRDLLLEMYSARLPWLSGLFAAVVVLFIGGAAPLAAIGAAVLISAAVAPLVQLFICQGRLRCPEGLPARLLIDLLLVAGALRLIDVADYLPDRIFLLMRALLVAVLVVVALWLLRILSRREDLETLRSLRLPISVALLAGPIAEWLGYLNLGRFLTLGVYGTGAGILLVWLLLSQLGHLIDALGDADNEIQSGPRQWLGYRQGERVPGLGAMHWLIRIGTLIGLANWLLLVWQVSAADTGRIRELVHEGFDIGAVRVVPAKLVVALLAFLILLALARWLRLQLGEHWLTRTKLDAGARQSVVSLTSYAITGAAILLALSMAGLDFQNIAIVAGALSVGIGFGLQNIVNNFVSGLILLFERPVRPGDWVIVGATEGYVRKISIRYTLIQTFDRAEVLVPNSELISSQVTNLMLSDTYGRVTIPVGVAYGTETRKVRDILHKVARDHPMTVLHDPRVSPPKVFFMRFGDSSLDFELRFFIKDIDYKLSVRSDILYAVDDAFREAGIEIPFPQRVVHVQQEPAGSGGQDGEGGGTA